MAAKNKKSLIFVAIVYLAGIFMGAIDTGIVTPARTIIQTGLGVDDKTGIWMITIYTLAYAASIPIMGKLADKYGRKYVYLVSIFLFGLGSLFCGLSHNFGSFTVLLIARAVQAIGGGGILPIATAEFGTAFPEEKRGMALGLVGGVYGIANIFGASAGSAILDIFGKANWQFIFYINIPITIFIVIAGVFVLSNSKEPSTKKIDIFGILVLAIMVLALLYGLRNIDMFDFANSVVTASVYPYLIAFVVLLPLFILIERRVEDPVMNLSYFTSRNILLTLVISFVTGFVLMGVIFVPQFAENCMKVATGSGGYFVIILGVFAGIGGPLSGKLIDKYGAKIVLGFGLFASIAGALFAGFIAASYPNTFTVVLSLVLIGLGLGFTIGTPLNYMMLANTRQEESNSALATLSLVRSIGTAIAPAILVGFLANAGAGLQTSIMDVFPNQIKVPTLPYSQQLTNDFNQLKKDKNLKKQLEKVKFPDLNSKTTIKIDMNGNSKYTLPDDLVQKLKDSDVTTITDISKLVATRMFAEMTPDTINDINNGINKGVSGLNTGIKQVDKVTKSLKKARAGIGSGITGIQTAIKSQKQALAQMNSLYATMKKMEAQMGGSGSKSGSGTGTATMPPYVKTGNSTASATMPPNMGTGTGTATMPLNMGTGSGTATMPPNVGTGTGTATMPPNINTGKSSGSSSNFSIIDVIPANVKSKIPASVLNDLKDVKTSAQLKVKINALQSTINKLSAKVVDMKKSQAKLSTAITKIKKTRVKLVGMVDKMGKLKASVPGAFEQAKQTYLKDIEAKRIDLEWTYQSGLNKGFGQLYLVVAIASAVGLLLLIFYREKRKNVI